MDNIEAISNKTNNSNKRMKLWNPYNDIISKNGLLVLISAIEYVEKYSY